MRIAIPRFGESVAPCFEYSATMAIFTVEDGRVVDQSDVPLQSSVPFDRVRLMKADDVDTVICGGVQALYEDLLRDNDIQVISWVSGKVEDLLARFIGGRLTPGDTRLCIHPKTGTARAKESGTVDDPLQARRTNT